MARSHTITRISKAFTPVKPTSKHLWHLASGQQMERKLETFLRGGIWFARLDTFTSGVPEGTLPKRNKSLLDKLPKFQVKMVKKVYTRAVKRSFASCWHMSDADPSTSIWKSFGGDGNGIAIRTTPTHLTQVLAAISGNDGPVHFGEIRYIDHWIDVIPEANVIEAAFVVQDSYAYEREARVLIHSHGTAASDHLAHASGLFGPLVKRPPKRQLDAGSYGFLGGYAHWKAIVPSVDAKVLIQEIVIGKGVDAVRRKRLVDLVTRYGLADRIRA